MFQTLTLASAFIASVTLQAQVQTARPVEYMTRAETIMSIVLARVPDVPVVRNRGQFADIPKGSWYEPYMLYAERIGIIQANEQNNLRPEESVTRAEFLKMLTITFGLPEGYAHRYKDVLPTSWFDAYAGLAQHYQLFELEDRMKLEPQRMLTREEAQRAFKVFERINVREKSTPSLEQDLAKAQSQGKLKLYTVISTRKQNVTLMEPESTTKQKKSTAPETVIPPSLPELRTAILTTVNAIRMEKDLAPLTYSSALEQSAQGYAEKMATEGFFGHTAPDGEVLKDRIARTSFYNRTFSKDCMCIKGYALGENLARGQRTPTEVVDAWMKSPAHRDAILNPDYTHIGIGVDAGVWVQHFGGVLLPGQTAHPIVTP